MTFETTAAGNKNGSTRPKGTNCLSLHDRTSLPLFFVGQYTGKRGRLQYGIFNKNRRAAGGGLHVSAMTNKNADAGLGVLRAKWRRTFQPRFRMRRRRGVIRRAVTAAPRAISFPSCGKRYGRKGRWRREIALSRRKNSSLRCACCRYAVRSPNALRAAAQLGFPSAQYAIQIVLFAPVEYLTYGSRKNVLFARTAVRIAHRRTAVQITAETATEYFDDLAGLSNTHL